MQQCLPPHSDPPYVNDERADLNPSSPAIEEKKNSWAVKRQQSSERVLCIKPRAKTPSRLCVSTSGVRGSGEAGARVWGPDAIKSEAKHICCSSNTPHTAWARKTNRDQPDGSTRPGSQKSDTSLYVTTETFNKDPGVRLFETLPTQRQILVSSGESLRCFCLLQSDEAETLNFILASK